jgi:hypothetical protein
LIETATFVCSICGESSTDICVYCTKDTCANHRCLRCLRCSDCCECEVPLTAGSPEVEADFPALYPEPVAGHVLEPMPQPEPLAELEPEPAAGEERQPEMSGVAAIILPEPEVAPGVHEATTAEELVRALPELFAPESEPTRPEPVAPATIPPPPEPEPDEKKGEHREEGGGREPE